VFAWLNGKRYPMADYYTTDKEDAIQTQIQLQYSH
jgi:hypothetical protein